MLEHSVGIRRITTGAVCLCALLFVGGVARGQEHDEESKPAEGETAQEMTHEEAEGDALADPHGDSRFSDEPIPLKIEGFPERPKPILELGEPFLGTGPLGPGIDMPGGAVWQPSLLVYGTARTAFQTFDNGRRRSTEWASRLDLFANLQLTGTERVNIGFRPLDQNGDFSGYVFDSSQREDGWEDGLNGRVSTLFFEGDLGELFPDLDPEDSAMLDWGFSIGRQPIIFQEGLLINDRVDGVALVRDTLFPKGGSDLKLTFFYGWHNINRDDNERSSGTSMYALFTEADFPISTIQVDVIYVDAPDDRGGDGFFWGVGAIQRLGHFNTAFRLVGSEASEGDSLQVSSGQLLFGEVSWTPHHTHDNLYVNAFWGLDEFSSAARDEDAGGPLGRTGILFAAIGLGTYGAPLGNRADNSVGSAVGYQMFLDETRKQIIFEGGWRTGTDGADPTQLAIVARYQQAIGQHTILQFDVFGLYNDDRDNGYGARAELRFKF